MRGEIRIGLSVVAVACCSAGCSRQGMHKVSGRVSFPDGQPLTSGQIILDTGDAVTGHWGLIRPDGTFEIGTRTPRDGVPKGKFRVYVVAVEGDAEEAPVPTKTPHKYPPPPKSLVHKKYTNPQTSGLMFNVPEETNWNIVVQH